MNLKNIFNEFFKVDGHEEINHDFKTTAAFTLEYKNLTIGHLTLNNGLWEFYYSKDFQIQDDIQPIIEFPNKSLKYNNETLWPFFSYRIPGLNQPHVQDTIRKNKIEKTDVSLLKSFGKFSIFSPFILNPV